ncbi:calcium-binding protein [Bradyrhizobium sp. 27S5]|uniref:beta strand repeat-containing protein n=1 Tax=Bradyrhizobium sp. 27S5 TaxID=3139728 RepID=UPI0030D43D70
MATFTGTSGPDTLIGTPNGSNTDDTLSGLDGNDTLIGGDGADSLDGGNGFDFASYSDSGTGVVASLLNPGNNTGFAAGDTYTSIEGLIGSNFNDTLEGNGTGSFLQGGLGADSIRGDLGRDYADYANSAAGLTVDLADPTQNTGEAAGDTYFDISNISGSAFDDTLIGDANSNFLRGGLGADSLDGGAGFDYADYANSVAGLVVDLADPTQNTGEAAGDTFTSIEAIQGSAFDDTLIGDANSNNLRGGAGADSLDGGGGTDYADYGNAATAVVASLANPASNTGDAAGDSYTSIEGIIGSDFDDTLTGDAGNNNLRGGLGADALDGGAGNDIAEYITASAGLLVSLANPALNTGEAAGDTYISIEGLRGSDFNDTLIGDAGDNLLDGAGGADSLVGGAGNDIYILNDPGDVITENLGEGTDTAVVTGNFNYTLAANVENLTIETSANVSGTGNALANVITGGAGNNVLDGGIGADTMAGGLGNDTYFVDNAGDVVTENPGEGTDTVHSTIDYTLTANVENLILDGTGNLAGTGNALANTITGNSGNNTLDGGAGADTMAGGLGNDTYYVDNVGDVVTENPGEGTDTVHSTIDYTLTANVENLILDGTGNLAGTGNALANTITGNSGSNTLNGGGGDDTLDGGAGADTMIGGLGNDTYYVDNAGDVVTENPGEGTDTVHSTINYALTANVENLILDGTGNLAGTGNALNNVLTGNSGNNTLDGGIGADTMVGGLGNDTYFVDNAGDVVTENSGEGTDTVHSTINYTLTANVENLILDGTGNLAGTGNALANVITGNSGNNTLDGGIGADTMAGGLGNDTYFVDNAGDVVTENSGEGTDTVHTTVTYSLAANVENLILDGSGNLTGSGNALNNVLTGNAGNNSLYGNDGNDTAYGGAGADILVLGNGDDYGDAGDGNDYIYAGAGNDVLIGGAGLDVLLGEDGNDVEYGGSGFNYLFGGAGTDTLIGSGGTAASDVNVMYGEAGADYLYGGQGTNYFYGGTGVDTMFGGSGLNIFISSGETDGNVIYGGSGQNYVYGSNGGDTVTGGSGVDVFLMGTGADNITGGGGVDYAWGGAGADTFNISDASQEIMVIQDFNTGGVNDFVRFAGTSLHSFADVQAHETYVAGINTTIITDAAGSAVWLIGVAPGQLDASMFKFS